MLSSAVDRYSRRMETMRAVTRWEPFHEAVSLQEQANRVFNELLGRSREESSLTSWAPAVDIFETEHELVVKADLPDVDPKDLDIRVENNVLTIRGDRKFQKGGRKTICALNAHMV